MLLSTYNGAQFVRPLIESVLDQTYSPCELWIRDDGSRDETPNIVAEYAARYPFIRVLHSSKGKGAATATVTSWLESGPGAGETTVKMQADITLSGAAAQLSRGLLPEISKKLTQQLRDERRRIRDLELGIDTLERRRAEAPPDTTR